MNCCPCCGWEDPDDDGPLAEGAEPTEELCDSCVRVYYGTGEVAVP